MSANSSLVAAAAVELAQKVNLLLAWARGGPGPVDVLGAPTDGVIDFGGSANEWNRGYFKELYLNGNQVTTASDISGLAYGAYHFNTPANNNKSENRIPAANNRLNFLVIGAGGQGGGGGGGGGGAGGQLMIGSTTLMSGGLSGETGFDGRYSPVRAGIVTRTAGQQIDIVVGGGGTGGSGGAGGSGGHGNYGMSGTKGGNTIVKVNSADVLTFTGGAGGHSGHVGDGDIFRHGTSISPPLTARTGPGAGGMGGLGALGNVTAGSGGAGRNGENGWVVLIPF